MFMAPNTLAQLQLSEDYVYGLQAISYCSLGLVPPYNGHLLFEGQKVNPNTLAQLQLIEDYVYGPQYTRSAPAE
ncbi:MAG: hypothetical protein ACI8ZN_001471 [Bacteroidia bacterium]|jgi:hypothetical protein